MEIPKNFNEFIESFTNVFLAIAQGDFRVRLQRTEDRSPQDVLSYLVNSTIEELEISFEKLEKERNFSSSIIKAIGEMLIVINTDRKIAFVNQETYKTLGYSATELVNANISVILAEEKEEEKKEDEKEEEKDLILSLIKKGFVGQVEKNFLTKDGGKIPVLFTGSVMRDLRGNVEGIVCVARDITDRKRAEIEREKLHCESDDLYHNAPCGYHSLDKNGTFIRINNMLLKWLGYSRDEVIGQLKMSDVTLPAGRAMFQENYPKLMARGRLDNLRSTMKRKDGSTFPVLFNVAVVKDAEGRFLMSRATIFDMTEHEKIEREKDELQAKLLHSDKLASIGAMAAGIAHEINNPLAIVKGFTNILAKSLKETASKNDDMTLVEINNAIGRIMSIVNGLRTYARADTEHVEALDLNKVIIETIPLMHEIAKKTGVEIRQELAMGTPHVRGNIGKIQQVLINLLTNACDALSERPTDRLIVIETLTAGENVALRLSDNGSGIPEAILSKIWDPFFTTKEVGRGTGLGLSISHSIIQSFGGSFEVSSIEGEGTTFYITLSRMEPPAPHGGEGAMDKKELTRLRGEVLVIDDEPGLCALLRNHMEEVGLTVTAREDPFAAIEIMELKSFDLIITDMQMPALTGIALIKKAREMKRQAGTKFIVLTGGITTSYSKEDRDFLRESVQGYLLKPWEQEKLVELVGSLLPQREG